MNIGVILAGGIGQRMGADKPKQFLEVDGKAIIIYTLEAFERHPLIDAVEVVCVESFQQSLWEMVRQYGLSKVRWITPGGDNCQASTRNGIYNLEQECSPDDIVVLHMAANPLVEEEIITDCIRVTERYGNAASAEPVLAYTFMARDEQSSDRYIPREQVRLLNMPLGYRLGEMLEVYRAAYAEHKGIDGNVYADTLYVDYGKPVYFSKGSRRNIKITTPEDLLLFKAYLEIIREEEKQRGEVSGRH